MAKQIIILPVPFRIALRPSGMRACKDIRLHIVSQLIAGRPVTIPCFHRNAHGLLYEYMLSCLAHHAAAEYA